MERPMPLPIELVLNVITCCLPAPGHLLSQSHLTTKTLLAFTLVCRETRRVANRYLHDHCVYLDSPERLRLFLIEIQKRPELRKVPSLFLAPFDNTIDDLPTCCWVREVLNYTCDTLTKLVVDIPLQSCYPEDDHLGVRPVLREGFERLANLEEFVSVQDELYLDIHSYEQKVVWATWPKLKRLCLFNVDATALFWRYVALHPALETLVLTCPDSLESCDPKALYCGWTKRPLTLITGVPSDYHLSQPSAFMYWNWVESDPDRNMAIIAHPLGLWDSHLVQVRSASEDGTLWEWEGECIVRPEQMSLIC